MVGQDTISQQSHPCPIDRLLEHPFVGLVILVFLEDRHPRIGAVEHVINQTPIRCSFWPSQPSNLTKLAPDVKKRFLTPFLRQLQWGAVSITGAFRENNEDSYVIDPEGRYFIVADGMGGQSAGEKASALAVELVPQKLESLIDFEGGTTEDPVKAIDDAVAFANSEIIALSQLDSNFHNMGTTIVFVVRMATKCFVGGVGDSRVYLLRDDTLEQLTTDHSLTQALVDAQTITTEEAANHRYRNVLYRYLGTRDGGTGTEAKELTIEPSDKFLICTDGVTDGIDDTEVQALLAAHDAPQQAAQAIVDAAEKGGSRDNISCIVLFADPPT